MALLNPLSCQAIAAASEGETPLADATCWICDSDRRVGVGSGEAGATTGAGAVSEARAGVGAPAGSLMTVPASSRPSGERPFIAAMSLAETPTCAASADSVSPQRTV